MRKDLGIKTYLYPQPVLIIGTYDKQGKPNIMNAAWGMIADYDKVLICLGSHKTTDNILENKDLTISIGDVNHVSSCDYVGLVSQNKEPNKVEKSLFTTSKAKHVNAPIINELSLCLECRLNKVIDDEWFLVDIINVSADESILDKNNHIDLNKFIPISFDPSNNAYIKVNGKVGDAFKEGKKLF